MDQASHIGHVGAQSKLNGSCKSEPSPLHSKRHEAGAQNRRTHIYVQIGNLDIWLSVDEANVC